MKKAKLHNASILKRLSRTEQKFNNRTVKNHRTAKGSGNSKIATAQKNNKNTAGAQHNHKQPVACVEQNTQHPHTFCLKLVQIGYFYGNRRLTIPNIEFLTKNFLFHNWPQ